MEEEHAIQTAFFVYCRFNWRNVFQESNLKRTHVFSLEVKMVAILTDLNWKWKWGSENIRIISQNQCSSSSMLKVCFILPPLWEALVQFTLILLSLFWSKPSLNKPIAQGAMFFIVMISSSDNCRFQNINSSTCAEEYFAAEAVNNLPIFNTPEGFPVLQLDLTSSVFTCVPSL